MICYFLSYYTSGQGQCLTKQIMVCGELYNTVFDNSDAGILYLEEGTKLMVLLFIKLDIHMRKRGHDFSSTCASSFIYILSRYWDLFFSWGLDI